MNSLAALGFVQGTRVSRFLENVRRGRAGGLIFCPLDRSDVERVNSFTRPAHPRCRIPKRPEQGNNEQ